MTDPNPTNEALRRKDGVLDQRQQQIDPAGMQRADVNDTGRDARNQPGHDPSRPREEPDHAE